MGQAIACCGKSDVDPNDVKTNFLTGNGAFDALNQSPKFAALTPSQRLALVIKIQSVFRGYLGRKRVSQVREHFYRAGGMMAYGMPDGGMQVNYDNPDVIVSVTAYLNITLVNQRTAW